MRVRNIGLLILILSLAGMASADLIVYDGFDYPAGSLGGAQGGIGWDPGVAWDGGQTVTAGGLSYPGLPVVGNHVATNTSNSFRLMPAGFSAANRTLWISFLCADSANPSWSGISPFMGGSEALFIGKPSGSANWGLSLYNAQGDAGSVTGQRNSTTAIAQPVFLVVRIINGASSARITSWLDPDLKKEPAVDAAYYDSVTAGNTCGRVLFDRVRIAGAGAVFYDELRIGDTYADVTAARGAGLADEPTPEVEASDIPRDTALNWTAGEFAASHDVYLGTTFADVNTASRTNGMGVLASQGQTAATYQPADLLAYGQTYYWRVDEVNAAPDNTIFKGEVWSFTVEPYGYPVQPVAATASSFQPSMGPENTINGSGLDQNGLHGTEPSTMWMSAGVQPNWIQYEFDQAYQLYQMKVWNSNQLIEGFLGFGAKNVTIETSLDGATWTPVAGVPEFAKAPGTPGYAANTTVDLGGAEAKYVKLTITANWGGVAPQTGLAEVQFSYVPVQAREPQPADAATDVSINAILNWRPGREATSHKVFFGTDPGAVADGTAAAQTVTEHSYLPASLDFGSTYYWKVDEVGAVTSPGNVWSFTAQEYQAIDDFESYTDQPGEEIFSAWIDGFTTGLSGSTVGYLTATGGTFGETTIVHGGHQSMPLLYDNTAAPFFSEAERTFATAQNWTINGADSLVVYFRGLAPAFAETASGGIMMNAIGTDIWGNSDQFRYAFKTLNGNGTLVARVDSLVNSNAWAKAGVMIRQNTDTGSVHAFTALTPGNSCSFQRRPTSGGTSTSDNWTGTAVTAPYWVRITRTGNVFKSETSPDGQTWTALGTEQTIPMTTSVLIGLAVTSHDAAIPTSATFSNISTTGNVTGSWQVAEIGAAQPEGNSAEGLYVAVTDTSGKSKVVQHPDPAATAYMTWQAWTIPLGEFTSAGVKMTAVKSLTIGVGNKAAPAAGGTGTMYFDDIGFGKPAQ